MLVRPWLVHLLTPRGCHSQAVLYQQEAVRRHPLDHRAYSGLRLSNGLRVLLVSDPTAVKAAAALVVNTGGMDDPTDAPGLTHFVEHAILLGSRRYPAPYHLHQYLEVNGGREQGITTLDNTRYQFTVGHWALKGALEIFAELFVDPAFDETTVLREARAIDYEYQFNRMPSEVAFDKAAFDALGTSHRINRFIVGNYDTLVTHPQAQGIPVHRRLVAHYHRHYSANQMQLVVVGREPIDELTRMVVARFSRIPNRNITRPPMGSPFTNLPLEIHIDPFQTRKLMVQFALAAAPYSHVQTQLAFIAYLFNHDGEGSLADALRSRGLARRVDACVKEKLEGFVLFSVDVHTTVASQMLKREILAMVFAYLDAIRSQATPERYGQFLMSVATQAPHFRSTEEMASAVATWLHQGAELSTVLFPFSNGTVFDPHAFARTAACFNTSNLILFDVSPPEESTREPWFGARYATYQFDATFLAELRGTRAEDFQLKLPPAAFQQSPVAHPRQIQAPVRLLSNTSTTHVWSVFDESIPPMLKIELAFAVPVTLQTAVHMALLKELMKPLIRMCKHLSATEGIRVGISTRGNSVILEMQHGQEGIAWLVHELAAWLKGTFSSAISLELAKRALLDAKPPRPRKGPLALARARLTRAMDPFYWTPAERAGRVQQIEEAEFQAFLARLPSALNCNVLSLGNFSGAGLLGLARRVTDAFRVAHHDHHTTPPPRFFPWKTTHAERTEDAGQVATLVYLHLFEAGDVEKYALAHVTKLISAAQFYHHLRTREQLGYVLETRFVANATGGGIAYEIQSRHPSAHVESRIEAFFPAFVAYIQAMPETTLAPVLQGIARVLDAPKEAPALFAHHWNQILSRGYRFDQGNALQAQANAPDAAAAQIIRLCSKDRLLAFLRRYLVESPHRRKVAIHVDLDSH